MMGGRILRRIRIIAPHPDGGFLYETLYSVHPADSEILFGKITELSLEKAYVLEQDVCDHRHTDEWYREGSPIPTHHICTDCGDKFPNVGDTSLWFPKVIEV